MTITLAVLLCIVSSVAYAAAALLQRDLSTRPLAALTAHPVWWLALVFNGVGAALHVAALRFGPLLLVQPFGLLTLVLALVLTASRQRRRLRSAEWQGLALICASLTGLLTIIDSTATASAVSAHDLPILLGALTLVIAAARLTRGRATASIGAAVAAGVSFAGASTLAQTITIELSSGEAATRALFLATAALGMAALAGAGLLLTQLSYRDTFGPAVATSTLANPVASALIGIILLGETVRWGFFGTAIAVVCAALAARGVAILPADPAVGGGPRDPLRARPAIARRRVRRLDVRPMIAKGMSRTRCTAAGRP